MSESRDEGAVKMVETGGGGEKKVRRSNADNSNRWEVGVREVEGGWGATAPDGEAEAVQITLTGVRGGCGGGNRCPWWKLWERH